MRSILFCALAISLYLPSDNPNDCAKLGVMLDGHQSSLLTFPHDYVGGGMDEEITMNGFSIPAGRNGAPNASPIVWDWLISRSPGHLDGTFFSIRRLTSGTAPNGPVEYRCVNIFNNPMPPGTEFQALGSPPAGYTSETPMVWQNVEVELPPIEANQQPDFDGVNVVKSDVVNSWSLRLPYPDEGQLDAPAMSVMQSRWFAHLKVFCASSYEGIQPIWDQILTNCAAYVYTSINSGPEDYINLWRPNDPNPGDPLPRYDSDRQDGLYPFQFYITRNGMPIAMDNIIAGVMVDFPGMAAHFANSGAERKKMFPDGVDLSEGNHPVYLLRFHTRLHVDNNANAQTDVIAYWNEWTSITSETVGDTPENNPARGMIYTTNYGAWFIGLTGAPSPSPLNAWNNAAINGSCDFGKSPPAPQRVRVYPP